MGKKSVINYLHGQVEGIYHAVGKGIGESRHLLKRQGIRSEKIHSDSTRRAYIDDRFHPLVDFAHQRFGIKSVLQLTDEIVGSWIREERIGKHLAASTINVDVAFVGKLEKMLTNFSRMKGHEKEFSFPSRVTTTREAIREGINPNAWEGKGRSYERPLELIEAIRIEMHQIMAELQYYGGLRAEGVGAPRDKYSKAQVDLGNFMGIVLDPFTKDRLVGVIEVTEKGGKTTKHYVPVPVYERACQYIEINGPIRENYECYLRSINKAAKATNQSVRGRGDHGLKHNFAEELVNRGLKHGKTQETIYAEGARQCAHARMNILPKYYLGR